MLRSVRMTGPPEPASAAVGQAALREHPVTADTGRQGQRDLARILANSALSGGFLDRALELIRASTGADTACILRACDDPLRLAVVAGAGDLHQPRIMLVPAGGPLTRPGRPQCTPTWTVSRIRSPPCSVTHGARWRPCR